MTSRRIPVVFALALSLALTGCGSSDSGTDTTAASDTSVAADESIPESTDSTTEPAESTAKKVAYCEAQDELADLSFASLTEAQASAASTVLDSVYTTFPADMKPHAGPLLDFFLQFQSMGGTANEEYDVHLSELNKFLAENC